MAMPSIDTQTESHLEVGLTTLVHPLPSRPNPTRYRAIVRGWQQGCNVILELVSESGPLRQAAFHSGEMIAVRYVHQGTACGFATQVLDQDFSRNPNMIRVAWPKKVEQIRVRRFERIPLAVPCRVTLADGVNESGTLVDISAGGCAVRCPSFPEHRQGQGCYLTFALPDGFGMEALEAVVRSVRHEGAASVLGCEFAPMEEINREAISFFVTATLERTKASGRDSRRILLVENRRDVIRYLTHELKTRGYETAIAVTVVDACYRLRMMPPSGLLVSHELDEMGVFQFCRLIHGTPGLEKLPIVVYGGDDIELERQAQVAGAVAYVTSAYDIEEVEATLARCIPDKIATSIP